jgi:hypothetical protein
MLCLARCTPCVEVRREECAFSDGFGTGSADVLRSHDELGRVTFRKRFVRSSTGMSLSASVAAGTMAQQVGCPTRQLSGKDITGAAYGLDHGFSARWIDLLAQPAHMPTVMRPAKGFGISGGYIAETGRPS